MGRPRAIWPWSTRDQIIHPGATALRFPWIPVGVKGSDLTAAGIVHVVKRYVGMPGLDFSGWPFDHPQSKHARSEFEQSGNHAIHGEIRPQNFLIEIVTRLPK